MIVVLSVLIAVFAVIDILNGGPFRLDDGSDEYDELQEKINDYVMLISDCEDRFEDLLNIPQ